MSEKLAIHGGDPVRKVPVPPPYAGASVYGEEEKKAVLEVLDRKSPYRYYGPDVVGTVKSFEQAFAAKIGTKHALAVSSGTASLVVALKAIGIATGDKVIVPANTFIASANAVVMAGGIPVFADVDDSLNLDPSEIGRLADASTKAVIAVPILGNPCEMDRIMEEARKHNLLVIEDVAQSCGSQYKGRYSGSYGDVGCFSLQMNKILTTGDGGAVTFNDDKFYERGVRYHDQGMFRERDGFLSMKEEDEVFIGQNFRMSEITGAIAGVQLQKLDSIVDSMRKLKKYIKRELQGVEGISFRRINDEEGDASNNVIMLLPDKSKIKEFVTALNAENISCFSLYDGNPVYMNTPLLHQRTVDRDGYPFSAIGGAVKYSRGLCPKAEEYLPRNVSFYLTPEFTMEDAADIVAGIKKVARALL